MPTLIPSPSSFLSVFEVFFKSPVVFLFVVSFAVSTGFVSSCFAFSAGLFCGSSSSNLIPSSAALLRRFFSSIFASSSAVKVLYFGLLCSVSPIASASPDNCIASCSFFNFAAFAAFSFSTCALTAAISASL